MKKLIIINLLMILTPILSYGSFYNYFDYCNISKASKANLEYIFLDHEEGTDFNCTIIEKRVETIEKLFSISPIALPKISLSIIEIGWDASNLIHMLNIPQDFERSNNSHTYLLNDKLTNAYLAHEFGHSIFIEYLSGKFPEFKLAVNEIRKNNKFGHGVKHLFSIGHIKEANELNDELGEREMETFTSSEVMSPIRHVIAMSELFSDLVSVLYLEDLKAFSMAAAGQYASERQIEENQSRDFSYNTPIETWHESEAHGLYAPVRSFIGKRLSFPMALNKKKEALLELMQIMSNELVLTYPKNTSTDVYELNTILIEKLKTERFLE